MDLVKTKYKQKKVKNPRKLQQIEQIEQNI
jgi:hypothetical protein